MADNAKLSTYSTYRDTTKILLRIVGLWPSGQSGLFYSCLPFLYIFAVSVTIFATLNYVFHHITHVPLVVKGMGIGTSLITVLLKICTMLIHRDQARELHQILEEYFMTAIENKRVTNLLLTGISTVRGLCWILIPTIFVMMGIYTATPIWNVLIQKRHHIEPVTYSLIYPGIYPWNISNGTIYRIHYTIETFASITIFSVSCGIDALFAYYVFLMIGQLRMMGYKLTRLDEQKNIEIVVKECVREYEVLLRCRNSVEDIFGPIILWMIGTTAVVQCALIFQLFQNARNITIARWILIVSHLIPKVTQTYIYSWSGSCLIAEVKRKLFHLLFWNAKWNLFTLNHLD